MVPSDQQPLPSEDHRQRGFRETCGGGDGFVADPALPQLLDVTQHKRGRDEPAPVAGACAAARSPAMAPLCGLTYFGPIPLAAFWS